MDAAPELLVRCNADLGEGICWHPVRRALAWVDITGGRAFELRGGRLSEWSCGQMVGVLAPAADGSYLAALQQGIQRLHPDTGAWRQLAAAPYDASAFRFNDGKVDYKGRLWVGTLSLRDEQNAAALYYFEPSGGIICVREGVSISNGISWTMDNRTMYYIDTPTMGVQRFEFDGERGRLFGSEIAVKFSEEEGMPDGCALDSDGNLWVAHWGGSRITQSDPRTGRRLRTVPLPVRNVTSCAFGGEHCKQLYVSTARSNAVVEELAGSVFVFEPGVCGRPCNLAGGEQ